MARKTNFNVNGIEYFRLTKTIGHKTDGTPIRKTFYGACKAEAEEKADKFINDFNIGLTDGKQNMTINILFPKWLFSVKANELKPLSLESYESIYRNHIKEYLIADIPLSQIKSLKVQQYYNELQKKNVSISNIRKIHKLLSAFFKYVDKEGYILKNPCSSVTIPKDKKVDVDTIIEKQKLPFHYFKQEEIPLLREAFKNSKYEKVVDFALGTGTRAGEIIGLKKTHLNFEKREIYIKNNTTRSAKFDEDGNKIGYETKDGTPKTDSSIDIIPMSDYIYDLLINLPESDSEYVFTINDKQIDRKDLEKVWRKILLQLCKKHKDFIYRVLHDLRHTFAVLLLLNGTDLYTIMKLMRHKKLSSTEIYLAVLPESKEASVNKLNYIFKN